MSTVALLALTPPDICAFGVRSLSSFLRRLGHRTKIVFLPGGIGLHGKTPDYVYSYTPDVLNRIVDIVSDADLIGLSFMTNYFDRAVQITSTLKDRLDIPVVWGGIHATCKPEEALRYADFVCVGEGEQALAELVEKLANGENPAAIPGIWSKRNGTIVKTGSSPLVSDLSSLPHYDFSNRDHFILELESNRVVPLGDELFEQVLPLFPYFKHSMKRTYRTMTDRGCPHHCTYCSVPTVKHIYRESNIPYFRHRSVAHVIDEMRFIKERFPFIEAIHIIDDTFFARSSGWLLEFGAAYKGAIDLPFYCQASPSTLSAEKLDILIDAGLVYVEMGIQTGSTRIRKLYNRTESDEKILEAVGLLAERNDSLLPPHYHVIVDNPWEKPEDLLDTVRLLLRLPRPYGLCIASLIFFPRTPLYDRAVEDGLIRDEKKDIYRKPFYIPPNRSYPHLLVFLLSFGHIPRWVFRILLKPSLVAFFLKHGPVRLYRFVYGAGEAFRLAGKGITALARGDWRRIRLHLKRRASKAASADGRKG